MPKQTKPGTLLCVGEFFSDIIFYGLARPPHLGEEMVTDNFALDIGGGAAITATVASKLGRQSELVTVLGSSALDTFALDELDRRGVNRKLVRQSSRYATGGVSVAVSTKRDRYFLTANGANEAVGNYVFESPVHDAMTRAQHVHFGLSPRNWRRFPALLADLRARRVSTSWDVGWRPEALRDRNFRPALAAANIVFMNQAEAIRFSGKKSVPDAMQSLRTPRQTLVVKLGRRGAIALDGEGRVVRAKAVNVKALDTTGAGDAFNAGFLHYFLQSAPIDECLRAANICGALSTQLPGGTAGAPTQAELTRLMRRTH